MTPLVIVQSWRTEETRQVAALIKNMGLRMTPLSSPSWLCLYLAVWPWASSYNASTEFTRVCFWWGWNKIISTKCLVASGTEEMCREMLVTWHHRPILRTERLVFKQIKLIQFAGGQEDFLSMGELRVKIWTEGKRAGKQTEHISKRRAQTSKERRRRNRIRSKWWMFKMSRGLKGIV